jgi:hypothetical protein
MKIKDFNAETQRTQRTQSHAQGIFSLRPSASPRLCVEKPSGPRASRFTFHVSRFTPHVSRARGIGTRHSPPVTRHPQNGVALIITLILLGVVTFMAIAFLALSKRERGAVATVTDTASARLAADAALAGAEAQVVANVLSTTNPCNFGLLVSTNGWPVNFTNLPDNYTNLYYSPRAPVFIPNPTNSSMPSDFRYYLDLNRNGRYDTNGWVTNLDNNGFGLGTSSFQVGDPEWIGILQRPDAPYGPNNPFVARYAFIALPVGNTLDLNAIHNQVFLGPNSGDPLVVNPPPGTDNFFRNQGVGSWEINLAAFLTDLNTNEWDNNLFSGVYQYLPLPTAGSAFDDARALLAYRYQNNYKSLQQAQNLFVNGLNVFGSDNIDGYSDGPLMTTPSGIDESINANKDDAHLSWAGADNTNHFFTHQELFDPNKTAMGVPAPQIALGDSFNRRLLAAGTTVSTYDRYTFYRLLSQLGTDSTPDSGRMNINYDNLTTNSIPGGTNFIAWTPLAFFTNAADRLLRAYTTEWRNSNPTNFATTFYSVTDFSPMFFNPSLWTDYPAFGIGKIPVLVSNQFVYSSAVNRLLQLAANMYDATTNNTFLLGNNYPSVFRPLFTRDSGGNVFVTGYTYVPSVTGTNDLSVFTQPFDASTISALPVTNLASNVNVYGVPWIIGAKKGFPSFNKFTMQNVVQITRKLQIARSKIPVTSVSDFIYTNQMFVFSISNSIGMDLWNSYATNYSYPVQIVVYDNLSMILTNDGGAPFVANSYPINANIPLTPPWPGSAWNTVLYDGGSPAATSFVVPINTAVQFMTNSVFYSGTTPPGVLGFFPEGSNLGWETNKTDFSFPNFGLLTTNRLQVFMLEQNPVGIYHIIDYAQFAGPESRRNLNAEFQTSGQASGYEYLWSTISNADGVPWGIVSQIDASDGGVPWNVQYWNSGSVPDEMNGFADFMGYGNGSSVSDYYKTNYIVQVPFSPTLTAYEYISWQANDPLVHYLASDLNFQGTESGGPTTGINVITKILPLPRPSFNLVNDRYQPWGRSLFAGGADPNPCNPAFKDPLVRMSDNWDFPMNKFPGVGWLGRVHRGTPWQTVYLKASDILPEMDSTSSNIGTNTWMAWTGNFNLANATYNTPVQDRLLFDLFTTAFNDNATRGTLSVNVGTNANLAAWSALFSGSVALSNNMADDSIISFKPQMQTPPPSNSVVIIQPAGIYDPSLPLVQQPPLVQLVAGINTTRATFTNADGLVGTFEHVGDILAVPALTEQSPFLHWWDTGLGQPDIIQQTNGISDEMYEWLPQQVMSLLRVSDSPRYVIYSYGQTLKPAPDSIVTSGGSYFGMITNYQIVSEIATRAVVRFNSAVTNVITFTNGINADGVNVTNWFTVPVVTNNNAVIESFNILPPD